MSFSAATYTSLYCLAEMDTGLRYAVPSLLYPLAAYVAYTRYAEHYHHVSDLLVGAAVGAGVTILVFRFYDREHAKLDLGSGPGLSLSLRF